MKQRIICASLLLVAVASFISFVRPAFAADSKNVAAVWAREDDYWRYVKAGDVERYRTLWHEKFIGWPCDQPHPKRKASIGDWVQKIRDEKIKVTADLTHEGAEDFGNIVVVHYGVHRVDTYPDGKARQGPFSGPTGWSKITHTWMKVGDTWQIIGGMCGPLPEKAK
jgi:ketosteroid isomerase-like protein